MSLTMIDLFSGRGGASQRGWNVITMDLDPRFRPDVVADVRHLPLRLGDRPDLLWASPPCTEFSRKSMPRSWFPEAPEPDLSGALFRLSRNREEITTGRQRNRERTGSRGGAPIWVMREAFIPPGHWTSSQEPDPDGFAVFGRFPKGWLTHVLKAELLGRIRRDELLHVCSGTLGPDEAWTVDIRPEARPRVVASGTALPFADATFKAILLDPPYSDEYAKNLYKTENPRPSWLLKEAARVVVPGGRIGILHVAIPFSPPACRLVTVWGISTGVGFRIRALTVYQKEQDRLL